MKSLLLLGILFGGLLLVGCGQSDPAPDPGMPPAASKEAGESRASQSGGGQFGRTSDKAEGDR